MQHSRKGAVFMSSVNQIATIIDDLYAVDRIITALQKKPNEYAGTSLYANEAHTLKLIAQNEGISQAALSEKMYRTSGATSVMVDKLVKKGLVNRRREVGNQRRYLLTLTERGRVVSQAHVAYDYRHARCVSEGLGLSEEELSITEKSLSRIIDFYSLHYLEHGMVVVPDMGCCLAEEGADALAD